jgi:hypothetical protein
MRAAAVMKRWRRQPRRLLFHHHTSTIRRSFTVQPRMSLVPLRHGAICLINF